MGIIETDFFPYGFWRMLIFLQSRPDIKLKTLIINRFKGTNMAENRLPDNVEEKRSEERTVADVYYSVQFHPKGLPSVYQFKIRNISSKGLCILIKEDSQVLEHITVGDLLEMTYYRNDSTMNTQIMKTRIKHISKGEPGLFEGHHLVGLEIE